MKEFELQLTRYDHHFKFHTKQLLQVQLTHIKQKEDHSEGSSPHKQNTIKKPLHSQEFQIFEQEQNMSLLSQEG